MLSVFDHRILGHILQVQWEQRVSNVEIRERFFGDDRAQKRSSPNVVCGVQATFCASLGERCFRKLEMDGSVDGVRGSYAGYLYQIERALF